MAHVCSPRPCLTDASVCVRVRCSPPVGTAPLEEAGAPAVPRPKGFRNPVKGSTQHRQQQQHHRPEYTPPPRRVTKVVLVGGSSRIPWVQRFVMDATGVRPSRGVDPEECVAIGAALYAGMLSGHVQGIELADGAYAQDLHGRASGFPIA